MSLRMLTNLTIAILRLTTAQQRSAVRKYTDRRGQRPKGIHDCRLSAKLVPNSADMGCHVVSATYPQVVFSVF
jgi:hypothetical protein